MGFLCEASVREGTWRAKIDCNVPLYTEKGKGMAKGSIQALKGV